MSRRKKKRNQRELTAKFTTGQQVRVKKGVASPDYPDIPLGGWAGMIAGRVSGRPGYYEVFWSEETLAKVPPVYLRRCERDDFQEEGAELPEEALEPDAGGPLEMEQPASLVTPPLSSDDQDDRVRAVFGLTSDDPLPRVTPELQRKYYEYLMTHLSFPFQGAYADNFLPNAPTLIVTGLKELSPDGMQSIMADARENDRPEECPLWNLVAEDDQIHEWIDDYGYWFYNFGGETPEDDELDSEEAGEFDVPEDEEEDYAEEDYAEEDYTVPRPSPIVQPAKVGRNDPCPCGSGKKYKKCCLKKKGEQPRGGLPEAKSLNELLKGAISQTFQQRPRRRDVPAEPQDTAYQADRST